MTAGRLSRRRSRRLLPAFTLIELIIALGIAAVLALTLVSSLYVAFHSRNTATRAVAPIRTAELAMELIRADIESAQPPHGILAQPFTGTLSGSSSGPPNGSTLGSSDDQSDDSLQFFGVADGPQHVSGTGEIKKVLLLVESANGSGDHILVRQVTANLLSPNVVQPDEEVICRHVSAFNLRYYDGEQWQTAWDSTKYQNTLPAAVEVTLELRLPDADPGAAPIHLRRIFPMACVSPPDTGGADAAGSPTAAPAAGNSSNATGSKGAAR